MVYFGECMADTILDTQGDATVLFKHDFEVWELLDVRTIVGIVKEGYQTMTMLLCPIDNLLVSVGAFLAKIKKQALETGLEQDCCRCRQTRLGSGLLEYSFHLVREPLHGRRNDAAS